MSGILWDCLCVYITEIQKETRYDITRVIVYRTNTRSTKTDIRIKSQTKVLGRVPPRDR
jgi:hypothetical protein